MERRTQKMNQIYSFIFLFLLESCFCQQCQFEDSKGNVYDFSALAKNNDDYYIPRNTYPNQPWDIWINICRALVTQKCGTDCAICLEWDKSPNGHACLGKFSTGTWMDPRKPGVNGLGLSVEYVGGDWNRKCELDMTCDPNAGVGKPIYNGEAPQLYYNFQWVSAFACPGIGCFHSNTCAQCTSKSTNGCVWCLDNKSCVQLSSSNCQNYISDQKYCPVSKCLSFKTCSQCTSDPANGCAWCLEDSGCLDLSSPCRNRIIDPNYCLSKINESENRLD